MSSAKKLLEIFEYIPESDQKTLMEFAEFLKSRAPQPQSSIEVTQPQDIPRPGEESVVAAIKRLTETYPMIERSSMFNTTSELMMQHMMQGRAALDIIDEMEALFEKEFKTFLERNG
jgi:hypothetical protein